MKKHLSIFLVAAWITASAQLNSASALEPDLDGQLLVVANTPLSEATSWSEESASLPVDILRHEGTINSVQFGEDFGLLSTNASAAADDAAAALVTSDDLFLAWDFEDKLQVEISIDGERVGLLPSDGSLTLTDLELGTNSEASFTQINPASEESEISTFTAVALPLAQPSAPTLYSATQTLLAATVSPPASTVLRYQTFIKDAFVQAPDAGCAAGLIPGDDSGLYYKGNGRGYLPGTSNNKTAFQANISWGAEVATPNITVGKTEVYSLVPGVGYVWMYDLQASKSGISLTYGTFYNNSVYIRMKHNVANPDCLFATGIYYDVRGKVYRTGGYALSGEFREAPWHEFYIKDSNNTTWQAIYRSDMNSLWGFNCFIPPLPLLDFCIRRDSWDESYSDWYHPPA